MCYRGNSALSGVAALMPYTCLLSFHGDACTISNFISTLLRTKQNAADFTHAFDISIGEQNRLVIFNV